MLHFSAMPFLDVGLFSEWRLCPLQTVQRQLKCKIKNACKYRRKIWRFEQSCVRKYLVKMLFHEILAHNPKKRFCALSALEFLVIFINLTVMSNNYLDIAESPIKPQWSYMSWVLLLISPLLGKEFDISVKLSLMPILYLFNAHTCPPWNFSSSITIAINAKVNRDNQQLFPLNLCAKSCLNEVTKKMTQRQFS